jgi:hypothetical protein
MLALGADARGAAMLGAGALGAALGAGALGAAAVGAAPPGVGACARLVVDAAIGKISAIAAAVLKILRLIIVNSM